jgi:hypothetical protein
LHKVVERPHFDVSNLEWIEYVHRDSVGPLVRKVATDSTAQFLLGLPRVDWFAVVVVESVYTVLVTADALVVAVLCRKELPDFCPDCGNVFW